MTRLAEGPSIAGFPPQSWASSCFRTWMGGRKVRPGAGEGQLAVSAKLELLRAPPTERPPPWRPGPARATESYRGRLRAPRPDPSPIPHLNSPQMTPSGVIQNAKNAVTLHGGGPASASHDYILLPIYCALVAEQPYKG